MKNYIKIILLYISFGVLLISMMSTVPHENRKGYNKDFPGLSDKCVQTNDFSTIQGSERDQSVISAEGINKEDISERECIGQTLQVYKLDPAIKKITGMSFREDKSGSYLYVMDGSSNSISEFKVSAINGTLDLVKSIPVKGSRLESPRGLAYSKEVSGDVFYFLDYIKQKNVPVSRLYRYDPVNNDLSNIELTEEGYGVGSKETFDVVLQSGNLFISFDPSDYADQVKRIQHGILKISLEGNEKVETQIKGKASLYPHGWEEALTGKSTTVKHLPGPGKTVDENRVEASLALANMSIDGVNYLWGTVGADYIYLLDGESGRGIFFFDMPKAGESEDKYHTGMAFGAGYLWVVEPNSNEASIHRINALDNPELAYKGPKCFREIRMRLVSTVRDKVETPRGLIYHTFLHPFPESVLGHQGVIPNTVHVNDLTNVDCCNIEQLYYNPAGDPSIQQNYTLATYDTELNPEIRKYQTEFAIKVWTRDYKHFIYPHLVKGDDGPPGTSYLEDDDVLYKYKEDPEIYKSFFQRVKNHIKNEYGEDIHMDNPYWVSRNIVEYVMENYHYPKDEEGYYASYDFEKGNYNSNPGNLKAELSADNNYEDNITACSGTGAMLCGALRSAGIPAVWIGVSQEHEWKQWKTEDRDDFLEFNEESSVGNGHRYNHVWLGKYYKWQRFDATPLRPNGIEFDKRPAEVSQWLFMVRSAAGVETRRVIHTIQSEFWDKLHVAFADCEDQVNNCGATRYNLLGTYTFPQDFNFSRNIIRYRAIQFIDDVMIDIDNDLTGLVSWKSTGEWDLDPDAKLNVVLEKEDVKNQEEDIKEYHNVALLVRNIPIKQTSARVDLNKFESGVYRIKVVKVGDPVTGNGKTFEITK